MNYITLDLEWNQAYYEQALAVQKRLSSRLRGEVIQIGAVKMDEKLRLTGSFSVIVQPRFFRRIHRHVAQLTGITQQTINRGMPLPEAAERFRRWCGEDSVFLTWGPDDLPMFTDNLRAHDIDTGWVPAAYDLQIIYNQQVDSAGKQRSLEHVMAHFDIKQNLPAHDALNDAYFTALVASRLDIAAGIAAYDKRQGRYLDLRIIGDADVGERGFDSPATMLASPDIARPLCPECDQPLRAMERTLHSKGQRYTTLYCCPQHGRMFMNVRVARNLNDTLKARRLITEADEAGIKKYCQKLAAAQSEPPRRRHTRAPKKVSVAAETERMSEAVAD
ncbi:MAG: 3'-5' exonuclease [Eubacteriales bacterium]